MLFIPDQQVDRAIHLVDDTGAADFLRDGLNLKPQGRPGALPLRSWLIGALLAVETSASFKNTSIHRALTSMTLDKQFELGVRYHDKKGEVHVITKSHCDFHTRWLPKRLACTPASVEKWDLDVDESEMRRRWSVIVGTVERLLDASLVEPGGSWYALDGSGTWSWGKSKRVLKDGKNVRAQEEVFDDTHKDEDLERVRDEVADGAAPSTGETLPDNSAKDAVSKASTSSRNFDPDARIGSKTSKSGKNESYYGYVLDAAIRISPPGAAPQPVVVERLQVSPASTDVVAPTLALLDSLQKTVNGVDNIVVDRHYSYKRVDRWADELRARGIHQHFDMRTDEHGHVDVDGMKLINGWMHCPSTPEPFARVERPGPTASRAAREAFAAAIAERQTWAMDRHEAIGENGRTRWLCPAMAGKLGCPLRTGTVETAKAAGLPIVTDPPAPDEAPKCCTNKSGIVSDRSDRMRKHQQPYYWGSPEWREVYDLRTYVEGYFGSLKNPNTEGVRRGYSQFVGLPMVSLGLAIAAAVCNVRHQRKFYASREDLRDHPLLRPDPEPRPLRELTDDEIDEHERRLATDGEGEAA